VGEDLWVEIQNPDGGSGWVNSDFLTEQVASSAFCSDARVTTLIQNLASAIKGSNDDMFAPLIHSLHGLDARLWRYGTVANYTPEEASWVFESEYEVNWVLPRSGENTRGRLAALLKVRSVQCQLHHALQRPADLATFFGGTGRNMPTSISTVFKPGSDQYGGMTGAPDRRRGIRGGSPIVFPGPLPVGAVNV
jgi:hypothetical protein